MHRPNLVQPPRAFSARSWLPAAAALLCAPAFAQSPPSVATAWFTDAPIAGATRLASPASPPPSASGTFGRGISLGQDVAIAVPRLKRQTGVIEFWIRPNWDGADGKTHPILHIGDPTRNGLLIEKSAQGMLRFVMASPRKMTASRADVSGWKAGGWHHVAVMWLSKDGKPLGLPLWIDKVAVDGPVAADNDFLDPAAMTDARVHLGGPGADATIDELVFRDGLSSSGPREQAPVVYRDYFLTAPYDAVRVDPEALCVPSDRRVVNGHEKQFGLMARQAGRFERITDYGVRYGQWADFDAKPFISWSTTSSKVATVDKNGMVTGHSVGKCKLVAEFRGMKAAYDVNVIPEDQPDLDLLFVERLPRYASDAVKNTPAPGDVVRSVAHIENYGFAAAPAGTEVRLELVPDTNRNFRLDPNEKPIAVKKAIIDKPLAPRESATVAFGWTWPNQPVFVKVTVDPDRKVADLCLANNERCDLNTARPLRMGYTGTDLEAEYKGRKINHIGSFSYMDWVTAEKQRMDVLLRDSVLPTTSPDGIRDALAVDNFYDLDPASTLKPDGKRDYDATWDKQPWVLDEKLYDGGFPVKEVVNLMAIDTAIIHELGHTCVSLPDLYGYPVNAANVFLTDENGKFYAGTDVLPIVQGADTLSYTRAQGIPCGGSYGYLMDFCHLFMQPAQAGAIQYYAGYRGDRFWGTQGRLVPQRESWLRILDVNDQPLKGAAVYAYEVVQTQCQDAGTKFFPDRPKFVGNTDADGRFNVAGSSDKDWDDPNTDAVEGEWPCWNPFQRAVSVTGAPADVAFTPNVWNVEGLLLIKIVSGNQTEFAWLSLTDLNEAYLSGETFRGIYPIATSLNPSAGVTPVVRKPVPDAIRKVNLKPVAMAPESITVRCGEEYTIDGSKSFDPEGQPLIYRWSEQGHWLRADLSRTAMLKAKAPDEPCELEYRFYVIDGLRPSDPITIKVKVTK